MSYRHIHRISIGPAMAHDDFEPSEYPEHHAVKDEWLAESPAQLARRIPVSVFALGEVAGLAEPGPAGSRPPASAVG